MNDFSVISRLERAGAEVSFGPTRPARPRPHLPKPLSTWQVLSDGRVAPLGRRPAIDRARGRRVLSADQVRAIRRRLAAGEMPHRIAADFPVSASTIASIWWGDSWKGVG